MAKRKPPFQLVDIPELIPSWAEFKNELNYLNSDMVRRCGMSNGIVKVITGLMTDQLLQ